MEIELGLMLPADHADWRRYWNLILLTRQMNPSVSKGRRIPIRELYRFLIQLSLPRRGFTIVASEGLVLIGAGADFQ